MLKRLRSNVEYWPGSSVRQLEAVMIKLPIPFPSETEKIQREVAEFRRLTSTERFLQIFGLSAF
jgi:hypothetical protein